MTTFLETACVVTVKELRELIEIVHEFIESMPESVSECLSENEEVKALAEEIGTVDLREVLTYITLHFKSLRDKTCEIKTVWNDNEFEEAGTKSAVLVKEIVRYDDDVSTTVIKPFVTTTTPLEAEQEFLNGFFTEFDLDKPTTIMKCFPTSTHKIMFDFVTNYFDMACEMSSLRDVRELIELVVEFFDTMPESTCECLDENEEIEALVNKIGPVDVREMFEYIVMRFQSLRDRMCEIKTVWRNENFEEAGTKTAIIVKEIIEYDDDDITLSTPPPPPSTMK